MPFIHFVPASHYADIPCDTSVEWGTRLMEQLAQSSELQVWMTILHNEALQRGDAAEERMHWENRRNSLTRPLGTGTDWMKDAVCIQIMKTKLGDI